MANDHHFVAAHEIAAQDRSRSLGDGLHVALPRLVRHLIPVGPHRLTFCRMDLRCAGLRQQRAGNRNRIAASPSNAALNGSAVAKSIRLFMMFCRAASKETSTIIFCNYSNSKLSHRRAIHEHRPSWMIGWKYFLRCLARLSRRAGPHAFR